MDPANTLCSRCQTINVSDHILNEEYPGIHRLGYFQDILKEKNCPLCKLAIQALSAYSLEHWAPGEYPVEMCYLGRSANTNRPGIDVWFNCTTETLPAGVHGQFTTLGHILPLDTRRTHARFLGETLDYDLVRSWLQDCVVNHGTICNHPVSSSDSPLSLLLLDVRRMRLVRGDSSCLFLALSYVWGHAERFYTKKENLEELQKDGAFSRVRDRLPRLISDAIDFVTAIGETYLWVDVLCIVQDDALAKEYYIPQMDKIYGRALLTMVALSSDDTNSALPGVTAGSRAPSHTPIQVGGLTLVAKPPSLSTVEKQSAWCRRGWTFQEGLFSTRRLYFSGSQVHWECALSSFSEACPAERDAGRGSLLEVDLGGDQRARFRVFESLVKQYSPRSITYASDSLNAFAGVLSAARAAFGWSFASALPEHAFDLALLWTPMGTCKMRPRGPAGGVPDRTACTSPTWCWTAWTGYIYWKSWGLDSYVGKDVTVEPCVRDYMIRDKAGTRKVVRDTLDASTQPSGLGEEDFWASEEAPLGALLFKAACLPAETYTISSPQPDTSRDDYSTYFKDELLCCIWIYSSAGHHCGRIWGMRSWDPDPAPVSYKLILLSRSGQDKVTHADVEAYQNRLPPLYPSSDEYYEGVFDTRIYGYKSYWALNVMLVECRGRFSQRVAVGQTHTDAWDIMRQKEETCILI